MAVTIVTVGDELLLGDTVNTNAAWLGQRLSDAGLPVSEAVTVGDDLSAIKAAVARAVSQSSVVIVTGGLGPTHDDMTREAISDLFERPLRFDEAWFARVVKRFEARGRTVPESNRTQAMVPEGFEVLHNDFGTAPGLYFETKNKSGQVEIVVLPGVPREMKHLVEDRFIPMLGRHNRQSRVVVHIGTAGIGESHLQELLGDLSDHLSNGAALAYLPSLTGLRLRVTGVGSSGAEARERADRLVSTIERRAGRFVFTFEGQSLEAAVGAMLAGAGLTVAVAESCTGGRVGDRLTDVPGSSRYVRGGVIAYCNSVKVNMLGVRSSDLDRYGSVSETVAKQMAWGVRERLGSDLGVSSTGILGPDGGSPEKPVGTVWIGISDSAGTEARKLSLGTGREDNKMRASTAVLDLLRLRLRSRVPSNAGG